MEKQIEGGIRVGRTALILKHITSILNKGEEVCLYGDDMELINKLENIKFEPIYAINNNVSVWFEDFGRIRNTEQYLPTIIGYKLRKR
jgi:hypothetical protein